MPVLVVLLLVAAVHLATNAVAWTTVGLIADDRFAVGLPALMEQQQLPLLEKLRLIFFREKLPTEQPTALYRPFTDLTYLLEYPWCGVDALGYHVVDSMLHCGTAMLWFALVRRLSGSVAAATATAIAFAGWPGHSEVTHWISARTNLQSTFFMVLALNFWDRAELCRSRVADVATSGAALLAVVVALGSKETAVLVGPLAVTITWLRAAGAPAKTRLRRTLLRALPLAATMLAWLWLRSTVLHTWGAGTEPAWQLDIWSPWAWWTAISSWLALLMAPAHELFTSALLEPLMWALHGTLIVLALCARDPGSRRICWLAAAVIGFGLLAIAGLYKDGSSLENIRYSYETALGLCTLLGLGIAALPVNARGPALGLLVVVHAIALDGNRDSWLRAGALHARLERAAHRAAAQASDPIWILDAPGIYEGAFVDLGLLNWTLFRPPFAPAEVEGRGRISSASYWRAALLELAELARQNGRMPTSYSVGWADGQLRPFELDASFPKRPWPDVTVAYARIARQRPFIGSDLPIHVLAETGEGATLMVHGTAGARSWTGPALQLPRSDQPLSRQLYLPLPSDLEPDALVTVELDYGERRGQHRYPLGQVRPAARSTRP